MSRKNLLPAALIASLSLTATPALAVTQGTLGSTSTGEIDVILDLAKVIQISALDDIDFTTVQPDSDATATESFCVYSNTVVGTYTLTPTSTEGTGGAFAMAHDTTSEALPYTLTLEGDDGKKSLTSGSPSADSFVANGSDYDCGSTNNATLEATVLATDMESRSSGSYSDTLVLVVTPD